MTSGECYSHTSACKEIGKDLRMKLYSEIVILQNYRRQLVPMKDVSARNIEFESWKKYVSFKLMKEIYYKYKPKLESKVIKLIVLIHQITILSLQILSQSGGANQINSMS